MNTHRATSTSCAASYYGHARDGHQARRQPTLSSELATLRKAIRLYGVSSIKPRHILNLIRDHAPAAIPFIRRHTPRLRMTERIESVAASLILGTILTTAAWAISPAGKLPLLPNETPKQLQQFSDHRWPIKHQPKKPHPTKIEAQIPLRKCDQNEHQDSACDMSAPPEYQPNLE
jgi:hypothetical protein